MSWLGMNFSLILVMSPKGTSPKFPVYVRHAAVSHSDENTHFPPNAVNGILMPPMPANRSINLNLMSLAV